MNKFIGVSLTLLMVASLASAAVIESPASLIGISDELARVFTDKGFASGAIVDRRTASVLAKTKEFKATPAEVNSIVRNMFGAWYIEGITVLLGGVKYDLVETPRENLVAQNGKNGIVVSQIGSGKWAIGVYGQKLTRDQAEDRIQNVAEELRKLQKA